MPHATTVTAPRKRRLGGWVPSNEAAVSAFRLSLAAHAKERANRTLSGPVRELYELVMNQPLLRMHLTQAIDEALAAGKLDPDIELGYETIDELMVMIEAIMTYSPPFSTSELVGCPINALLDWPMCMPSGFAFFQFPEVNEAFKAVLDHWSAFLDGPYSRGYLTTDAEKGWFGEAASDCVDMSLYECEPDQPHYGFRSWNDFFTRRFKPGVRPVAGKGDCAIVVCACESTPYKFQNKVKPEDSFWIKGQPYSLRDMFSARRADLVEHFAGGTIYQAFLSAYNFHRWHAPVSGVVTDAYLVGGTYYSEAVSAGLDAAGPNDSQSYITAVAARAVIVIDTGTPELGKVACVFVGMAEISSCVIVAGVGQTVEKGEELGYFQYGGSTHCLIFQPHVTLDFVPKPPYGDGTPIMLINSELAKIV